MLSPKPSRHGSFKRARENIESPTCLRRAKKPSSDAPFRSPNRFGSDASPRKRGIFASWRQSLGQLTPLATPTKKRPALLLQSSFDATITASPGDLELKISLEKDFSDLSLWSPGVSPVETAPPDFSHASHRIFEMPEILDRILRYLENDSTIPQEKARQRRRPQSLSHALLMYNGDRVKAERVWQDTLNQLKLNQKGKCLKDSQPNLYNCLLVNKLWFTVTFRIMTEKLFFDDHQKFQKLLSSFTQTQNNFSRPTIFVLHKLSKLSQAEVDAASLLISSDNLKWLELYICPKVLPPLSVFQKSSNLEKLVLPGNRLVTDEFLMRITPHLPKLKLLDLRACDKVSDSGVVSVSTNCPQLGICNLGRHRNGHLITSVSLVALARHTQVETVGAAGCEVTDAGVWELAMLRGPKITRLSLNNCRLLTNNSMPALMSLNYFPNISVIEVRNIPQISDLRPLVAYRKYKRARGIPILIEGCERIELLMKEEEWRLDTEYNSRVLSDLTQWVNAETD